MSLQTRLIALINAIGADYKSLRADVTAHTTAEDPHPQYFRKGQPLQSSTSTPEGTSATSLDKAGVSGQFTTRFYTGDPEVEGTLGGGWSVSTDGLTASSSQTEKSTANPVYYEREEQEISLTRFGITAELTRTVNNEAGYSQELLGGTTLKFPSGITKLTLPATGNVATPETLSTREWVRARDSAHVAAENPHPQYFRRDQPIQGSTSANGTGSYGINEMGVSSSRVYGNQEDLVQLDNTLGLLIARKEGGQEASFVSSPQGILRLGYSALDPDRPDARIVYPGTGSGVETFATQEWVKSETRVLYGTGNPNGVHAAPIGSMFRNTEAGGWNGARVWRKDTGTGNTGWVVESGDTGWRDLSQYLVNGAVRGGAAAPAGGVEPIRIRRSGDTVTFQASIALPTWVSGQAALDFPADGLASPTQYMPPGYSAAPLVVLSGGLMRFYTTSPTSAARYMWTWVTVPTWPTTLPGTPI